MKTLNRVLSHVTRSNSQIALALMTSLGACLVLAENTIAAVPGLITYQGRLTDATGTPVPNGAFFIRFQIYDASVGGTSLWNSGIQPVQVTEGVYTYILGQDVPFPAGLFTGGSRWLGITVGVDPELSPRKQMVATSYAFVSQNADSVDWGGVKNVGVTSAQIIDGQIVNADISGVANIVPGKISGVAATLAAANVFAATNTFDGTLISCDSTLRVDCTGITMGRNLPASSTYLLQLRRNFNTSSSRYGIYTNVENVSSGTLIGSYSRVVASTAEDVNSGTVYGSYAVSESDNATRYGSYSASSAKTSTLWTGTTYGSYSYGADGADAYGLFARGTSSTRAYGVYGEATSTTTHGYGVYGYGNNNTGNATGVFGYVENTQSDAFGLQGYAVDNMAYGYGVRGVAQNNDGNGYGVYGSASGNLLNWAGYFSGDVNVTGTIFTPSLRTRIDHPLDPENKYLQQALVESPEMKSIYDGIVVLDPTGSATIVLPNYCESVNKDFRYLLTPVGAAMPNLHVATEVASNQFSIAGGQPGEKVSWQVTGIRKDPWAEGNHVDAVVLKPSHERGKYIHPEVWGKSAALGSDYEHTKPVEAHRPANQAGPDVPNNDQ